MSDLEDIAREMGAGEAWEEANGSPWLRPEGLDVRRMAQVMLAHDARFVTITARAESEDEPAAMRLSYHWDLEGRLLTIETRIAEGGMASIRETCPAADWIEREIHDCFAVEFQGARPEPLLLRPGQSPGVFRGEDE
ncbi:MAG TPA: NADH-quinone oxidoreductase subunit C [Anaeromyxobacter sp.]|nr:NADH-quinone oxidoreductase subunit C [Anaeromyxobacter sp.]